MAGDVPHRQRRAYIHHGCVLEHHHSPVRGGRSSITNLWQRTTEGTRDGLTWAVLDDGTVTCEGVPTSAWCPVSSANVSVSTFGMHPGRTYSLDSGIDNIQTSAMLKFYGTDGAKVGEQFSNGTFVLPADTDKIECMLYIQDEVGQRIDLTFKPMLVEGAPADYVPYALGGRARHENLWRWGNPTVTENLRFDLLDDGGLSVYYDGVDPNLKWGNIMWRGTLEDAGLQVGETYYLAEFGTATAQTPTSASSTPTWESSRGNLGHGIDRSPSQRGRHTSRCTSRCQAR